MLGLILLATIPTDHGTTNVRCEVQEWNEVYDMQHDPPLCHLRQLILRDPDGIRDWRANRRPFYDHERGCYRAVWIENGQVIEVRSPAMIETTTEWDRELVEREWLPVEFRRKIK